MSNGSYTIINITEWLFLVEIPKHENGLIYHLLDIYMLAFPVLHLGQRAAG
jgi:hypothetical protein